MKEEKKEFRRTEYFIIFALALIPRLVFILFHHYPFRTPMDEMSTFATAAYGAGYDWSPLTQAAKHYYGGGFTILLSPLVKWIENPELLFGVVLSVYAVMQSISAPIACYMSKNYMKIKDRKVLYLLSLVSSYLVVARTQTTLNEHALIGVTWGIAFFLCKLLEHEHNYRKKSIDTVLLFLLMSYALTIHTRTKMFWIVIILVTIVYYLFQKKWLVAKTSAVIAGGAGYFLAGRFIEWVKKSVWLWQEGQPLKNTSVNIEITGDMLKTPEFYQAAVSTVFGQIHTSFIFTCGLTAVGIVCFVMIFMNYYKTSFFRKKGKIAEENPEYMKYVFVLLLFFALCIGGTIFAQSLTWNQKVMNALNGKGGYGFKAYTYIRYYGIYLGPFFYGTLVYLYNHMEVVKEKRGWLLRIFGAVQFLFLLLNLPYIAHNNVASEVYWPFALWNKSCGDTVRLYVYLMGILISSVLFVTFLWLLHHKKYKKFIGIFLAVLFFQYGWNAFYWDGHYMEEYEEQTNAGYAFIKELEEQEYNLPQEIYVKSTAPMGQTTSYIYQFLMKEHTFIPEIPKYSTENVIILCNEANIKKLQKAGYTVYALDEDEYISTNSEKVMEFIQAKGLKKN